MSNTLRQRAGRYGQRGVGLVELMVTMLVGAIIIGGVIALFNANRQTFRLQDNLGLAQESGSFALDFMARDIRLAGFPGGNLMPLAIDIENSANNISQTVDLDGAGPGASATFVDDRLAITYQTDTDAGISTTCTGDVVADDTRISNVYWVRTSADGTTRELVCQGFIVIIQQNPAPNGPLMVTNRVAVSPPQALISGVDSFQVQYGIDTTADRDDLLPSAGLCAESPSLATRWVRSTELAATRTLLSGPDAGGVAVPAGCLELGQREWVRAVRIGLLLRTDANVNAVVPADIQYTILDRTVNVGNFPVLRDGRIRRLFLTTVSMRNAN